MDSLQPFAGLDVVVLGAGNSGESLILRCQAIAAIDGFVLPVAGLNNDHLAPR